jgi:hypothetical protein
VPNFAEQVVAIATDRWNFFGRQTYDVTGHTVVSGHKKGEDGWFQRVGEYWVEGVNLHGIDGRNHDMPWSAAFISWVMKNGGAGTQFRYSSQHSVYIAQSIRDHLQGRTAAGYWGWRLNDLGPSVGDVVCWSRQRGIDFDHQNGGNYAGIATLLSRFNRSRCWSSEAMLGTPLPNGHCR